MEEINILLIRGKELTIRLEDKGERLDRGYYKEIIYTLSFIVDEKIIRTKIFERDLYRISKENSENIYLDFYEYKEDGLSTMVIIRNKTISIYIHKRNTDIDGINETIEGQYEKTMFVTRVKANDVFKNLVKNFLKI